MHRLTLSLRLVGARRISSRHLSTGGIRHDSSASTSKLPPEPEAVHWVEDAPVYKLNLSTRLEPPHSATQLPLEPEDVHWVDDTPVKMHKDIHKTDLPPPNNCATPSQTSQRYDYPAVVSLCIIIPIFIFIAGAIQLKNAQLYDIVLEDIDDKLTRPAMSLPRNVK